MNLQQGFNQLDPEWRAILRDAGVANAILALMESTRLATMQEMAKQRIAGLSQEKQIALLRPGLNTLEQVEGLSEFFEHIKTKEIRP